MGWWRRSRDETRVVRDTAGLAHRAEELARQLDDAAAFEAPDIHEESAPRELLIV